MKELKCPTCNRAVWVWDRYKMFNRLLMLHILSCTKTTISIYTQANRCMKLPLKCMFEERSVEAMADKESMLFACRYCPHYWNVREKRVTMSDEW